MDPMGVGLSNVPPSQSLIDDDERKGQWTMEPLASLKTLQAVIGIFGYEKNGSKKEISVLVFAYLVGG